MTGKTLAERVGALEWYHTIELAPGVVTPGWFDLRGMVGRVPLPVSLADRRCLDVGTFDGFWAFEMERRGADEVCAVDVLDPREWDWPAGSTPETVVEVGRRKAGGAGFELARDALGSKVQRVERSVYDLDPTELGAFDLVYVGSLLLHLRDPVGALTCVRSMCQSQLVVVDAIDPLLSLLAPRRPLAHLDGVGRPWWWRPNLAALVRMVEAAGFRVTSRPAVVALAPGPGQPRVDVSWSTLRARAGREAVLASRWGDPHAVVSAVPASTANVAPRSAAPVTRLRPAT